MENTNICKECEGSGWEVQFIDPCKKCGGTGCKNKAAIIFILNGATIEISE